MTNSNCLPGNLFVVSAPSGAGKTTLVRALTAARAGITVSVSHTTRPKRPAERDGIDYHFVSKSEFDQMIAEGKFLEHATIFGNLYGTSREWVENTLKQGMDVILEIDWQGCQHVQQLFPDCISIFIVPPSPAILAERLTTRGQDSPAIIAERLADARETFAHRGEYDYIVLNDSLAEATADLGAIIRTIPLQRQQQEKRLEPLFLQFLAHL